MIENTHHADDDAHYVASAEDSLTAGSGSFYRVLEELRLRGRLWLIQKS